MYGGRQFFSVQEKTKYYFFFQISKKKTQIRKMSDWDTVTVLRKRQPKASTMKTEGAINQVCWNNIYVFTYSISFLFYFRMKMNKGIHNVY